MFTKDGDFVKKTEKSLHKQKRDLKRRESLENLIKELSAQFKRGELRQLSVATILDDLDKLKK